MLAKGKNAFIFYKEYTAIWNFKISEKWTKNMRISDYVCQQLFYH